MCRCKMDKYCILLAFILKGCPHNMCNSFWPVLLRILNIWRHISKYYNSNHTNHAILDITLHPSFQRYQVKIESDMKILTFIQWNLKANTIILKGKNITSWFTLILTKNIFSQFIHLNYANINLIHNIGWQTKVKSPLR